MKVMVWDGDDPAFLWSLDDAGGIVISSGIIPIDTGISNPSVFDPDVVLSEGAAIALIAYEANGNIYVCSKEWDNNQFVNKFGPFCFGPGTNPNVDASHRYKDIRCVVTWENNNTIFAKACNIEGLDTSSTLVIKPCIGGDPRYHKPDVALYLYEGQTDTFTVVSFAFAAEKPNGSWSFQVLQYYIDSLTDPTKGYLDTLKYPNRTPNPGSFTSMVVGYPRIAAPALLQDTFDFSMVVDVFRFNDKTGEYVYEIWNFTSLNGNLQLLKGINYSYPPPGFDTTPYENSKPVITYCGDNIHVAWEYYDKPCEIIPQNFWHVIKLPLSLSGTPTDDYSVVNYATNSNHQKPSIAGRFSYYNENLYTFYDILSEEIKYKASYCTNPNLRKSRPVSEPVFYPNPTSGMVYCKVPRDKNPASISLYDSRGRILNTLKEPAGEIGFDLTGLPSGIYLAKVVSGQRAESFRICKQ